VGSITHTDGYCAVVAASASKLQSVGLDAERDKPLARDLVQMICTPAEQCHVTERDAVVYFAAKEAFYKCQYPLTRQFLDFHDVTLTVDLVRGTFRVQLREALPRLEAWVGVAKGRFLREQGLVVCGISMPHTAS
jgi:4'-phosphopantetheinyl transferase EntD